MSIEISIGKKWLITSKNQQVILNKRKVVCSENGCGDEVLEIIGSFRIIEELVSELIHMKFYDKEVMNS